MKILFVENRQRTGFWDAIAKQLQNDGHTIFWIVQNHLFTPKTGKSFVIPYYKQGKHSVTKNANQDLIKIIKADRGLNHNQIKTDDFIFYYNEKITAIFNQINPDIAFGEATQFHELIASKECRNRNILFLQPTSCRYPVGRISFYKYDTLETFGGCAEKINFENAMQIINSINSRNALPDYMIAPADITIFDKIFRDRLVILSGYLKGEKFATPNPLLKIKQLKQIKKLLALWDQLAIKKEVTTNKNSFKVLYPLQLQPESSIDVWATELLDQLQVVKNVYNQLNENEFLIIKLNPRSFLELSNGMIDFCYKEPRIIMLPTTATMKNVFNEADLVVTINGTVALESVFANKPIAILSWMLTANEKNCVQINDVTQIRGVIKTIKDNTFPKLTDVEKVDFLNKLNMSSYQGVCGDDLYQKQYLQDEQNMGNVINAFRDVIKLYESN